LVFIWNLVLGTWSFARELPPILQVLEREPSNLEDIEELVDFRWYDVAWEALKQYPKEEKVLFLKAKTLAGLKKYDEALQLFDSLIRDVQNPEIRRDCILRKAYILTRLKRYNEATQIYENLIKNIPVAKMQRKLSARAFKVALEARNYQKALQLLKGMGPAETSWWRGWCLFRLGRSQEALKQWSLFTPKRHKEFYTQALFWKSFILEELGKTTQAKPLLQELVTKYPLSFYGILALHKLYPDGKKKSPEIPKPNGLEQKFPLEFQGEIKREAKVRGLEPYLVFALVWQESRFRDWVISPVGAIGLMQLMPQTALQLAKASKIKHFHLADILEPSTNIKLGSFYLKFLKQLFSNQIPYVLAAYNAGEEAVSRWLSSREDESVEIFIEEIPFDETQKYVKKVLAAYWLYHLVYNGKLPETLFHE